MIERVLSIVELAFKIVLLDFRLWMARVLNLAENLRYMFSICSSVALQLRFSPRTMATGPKNNVTAMLMAKILFHKTLVY